MNNKNETKNEPCLEKSLALDGFPVRGWLSENTHNQLVLSIPYARTIYQFIIDEDEDPEGPLAEFAAILIRETLLCDFPATLAWFQNNTGTQAKTIDELRVYLADF